MKITVPLTWQRRRNEDVLGGRSFTEYLVLWLEHAAREFGVKFSVGWKYPEA
jgi:sarcosine oxidase gamma subunit